MSGLTNHVSASFTWTGLTATGLRSTPEIEGTTRRWLDALVLGHGIEVADVIDDSPASRADVAPGDILVSKGGLPLCAAKRLDWLIPKLAQRSYTSFSAGTPMARSASFMASTKPSGPQT